MSVRLNFLEAPSSFKLLRVAKFMGSEKKYAQESLKKQTKPPSKSTSQHSPTSSIYNVYNVVHLGKQY